MQCLNRYISLLNAEPSGPRDMRWYEVLIDTYRCLMQNLGQSKILRELPSLNRYISLLNAEQVFKANVYQQETS